jgi:hypothetical protein
VNIDFPASLTASTRGTGTVPPTATSGSLSVPIGNAHNQSTETVRPSTDRGEDGNNSAARKLALSDLLTMISREAKLTGLDHEPREQADERTSACQLQHPPNPVGARTLTRPNEASHEKVVADTAAASQTSRATMFDGIGTTVGIDLVGVSKTQIKKQLPPCWCMQCLACHPYPDKMGHHHIRSLRDNAAMHEAIRAGDLSTVDPWHDVLNDLGLSQPQPPQPLQSLEPPQPQVPRIRTAAFEPTEEEAKVLERAKEEGDGIMNWLFDFVDRKNEAIDRRNQAPQPQPQLSGSYASAAPAALNPTYPLPGAQSMQPTGPPPRKRKHRASGDNQNARSKRRYRIDFRDSVLQRAQTPGGDDQTVLETVQTNDVPENSTLSKMPQTDEAATAVKETAASKKLT